MNVARIVAGALLGIFATWIIVLHWSAVARRYILKRPGGSWIPVIGGVLGAAALVVLPLRDLHSYWWLPLVVDWGSAPGLLQAAVAHWRAGKK
jgi:uncharacterized membrane protein HdeD (DUF308 family)